MLKKYDHIIWDWNGTLVDDVDLCVTILNKILPEYNLPLTSRRQYVGELGKPIKWNFNKFLIGKDGNYVAEIGPRTKPYNKKVITLIEEELAK